jgi:hypothetical protein
MYAGGGSGLCWLPGNAWVPYYVPVIGTGLPRGYVPPHLPAEGGGRILAVGRGPTASTLSNPAQKSVLETGPGDAGLGIPRGVGNLEELNRDFVRYGQVKVPIPEPGSSRGNVDVTPRPVAPPHVPTAGQGRTGSSKGQVYTPPPVPPVQTAPPK